jgi:tripartite-type tricarboxylate transporter receptor subunit TctC
MAWMRAVIGALVAFGFGLATAHAEGYPDRAIKLIMPFTPGSPVDAAGRIISQHVQMRLGQSIIIENRPGAGTTIGTKAVMTAPPDGYTLLFIGPQVAYTPYLYPNFPFDPNKSLAPVATVVTWSHVMVVAPSLPVKNVRELVAYAKANPGKLSFGYGLATAPHLLAATFKEVTGTDINGVPYKGGEQARGDLLGGRIDINMAPVPSLLPLIQDGKARPIAYTGTKRNQDLPDVPTMAESGYPQVGYNPDVWLGFLAPAGTPADIINKFNAAVNDSLRSEEMKPILAKLGFEPQITTPEEFGKFIAAEVKKWPPLLQAAGLKPE